MTRVITLSCASSYSPCPSLQLRVIWLVTLLGMTTSPLLLSRGSVAYTR